MGHSTMPSGRSAGSNDPHDPRTKDRLGTARRSHAISGAQLKHLTRRSHNLLTGSDQAPLVSDPSGLVNPLTGEAIAPLSAPAVPLAAVLPAPSGRQTSDAVASHLQHGKMDDAELVEKLARFIHMRSSLRNVLEQDHVTHADVAQIVADAIRAGVISHKEAPTLLREVTHDPAHLRAELLARLKYTNHALVHLAGEAHRRENGGARA